MKTRFVSTTLAVLLMAGFGVVAMRADRFDQGSPEQSRIQIGSVCLQPGHQAEPHRQEPRVGRPRQLPGERRGRVQRLPHGAALHEGSRSVPRSAKADQQLLLPGRRERVRPVRVARHHAVGERQAGGIDVRPVQARHSDWRGPGQSGAGAPRDALARVPDHVRSRSARGLRLPVGDPRDPCQYLRHAERVGDRRGTSPADRAQTGSASLAPGALPCLHVEGRARVGRRPHAAPLPAG